MDSYVLQLSMVLLGLFLIIAYSRIIISIPSSTDVKSDLARSLQGIYTIGIMMLSVGITLFATKPSSGADSKLISYIALLLGIVITTLGGILVNKTSGEARTWSILILVLGLLFVVVTGFLIFQTHKDVVGSLLGQKYKFDYGCPMRP